MWSSEATTSRRGPAASSYLQRAPPRFDHGVRERQFREGQDAAQHARGDQVVDFGIHVLDAGIRQHHRRRLSKRRTPTRIDQHGHTVHRRKRLVDALRQNASRKVVDDRMEIRAGPVEQPDDRRVDVPHLVGPRRAKADLRFRRMHTEPWPPPAVLLWTSRYQVEGAAHTLPSRWARMASVPVGTCR